MLSSKQKLVYSWLCFTDQTPWQLPNTALNIYSLRLSFYTLNHNHDKKKLSCVIHFQFYQLPISIQESATHHISHVTLLQENVKIILWLTEKKNTSFVPILSITLELSDRDDLHPLQKKSFVAPTRTFSFPTPIALLIRDNTANCATINWCKQIGLSISFHTKYVNAYPWQRRYSSPWIKVLSRHPLTRCNWDHRLSSTVGTLAPQPVLPSTMRIRPDYYSCKYTEKRFLHVVKTISIACILHTL